MTFFSHDQIHTLTQVITMGLQPSVATSFMLLNQRIEVGVVSRQLIIVLFSHLFC